ncbi:MAG: PAS domain S-box protein [Deltaproteobacteria bacterium]|nr:PAS domain S-box protein [Deltaproteobacteria bacterium]
MGNSGNHDRLEAVKLWVEELKKALYLENKERISKAAGELQESLKELQEPNSVSNAECRNHELGIERQRYRDLFDFAPDGYLVTDTHGTILEANRAAAILFKAALSYLSKKNFSLFFDDQTSLSHKLKWFMNAERVIEWEETLRTADGSSFPASITAGAMHDACGSITGFRWLIKDITERKRIEEDLIKSEQKYRTLVEGSSECICHLDLQGRVIYINPKGLELNELSCTDFSSGCVNLILPEYAPLMEKAIEEASCGRPVNLEYESLTKKGNNKWWMSTINPIRDEMGNVISLIRISRDITQRKLAEKELEESKALLQQVLDNSNAVIYMKDRDGRYLSANKTFEKITGVSKKEIERKTTFDLYPRNIAEALTDNDKKVLSAGVSLEFEEQVLLSGQLRVFISNKFPIFNSAGIPVAVCGISTDITERKLSEERIRHLNRMLRTFYEINHRIIHETDRNRLLSETCRILVEYGGFKMASIVMADFDTGTVAPVAYAGAEAGYFNQISLRCDDTPQGNGPTGRAIRSGSHIICRDTETDECFRPWKEAAREREYRSSAAFPLIVRGFVIGAINIYAEGPHAFGNEEVELILKLANNVGFALQTFDDIQERRNAEEKLRAQLYFLQSLIDTVPTPIFFKNREGLYLGCNKAFEQVLGLERDKIIGKSVYDLAPKELADKYFEMDEALFNSSGFQRYEAKVKYSDGIKHDIIFDKVMTHINGAPAIVGVMTDIGDRKRTEEALRESEERFHQIFDQNEYPQIILKYGTCEIVDVNPAATALYGFTREEFIENGPALIFEKEFHTKCTEVLHTIKRGETLRIELIENFKKDGTRIMVSIRGQLINLRESVVYCTFRDITEKIRMEKEARAIQTKLIHANKMTSIGTLASGVAHEINNPNNFILFNSSLLTEAWDDATNILAEYYRENGEFSIGGLPFSEMREVVPELLSGITDGSRRIKGIVDSLKDFSRVDRAGMDGEFDLNRAVLSTTSILNNQINKYTDCFYVACAETLPPVKGSSQKIEQVLINLIINALHALPDKKCGIWLNTSFDCENKTVLIKIKDEGVGMPKEVLERITEPFFTTKADTGGTGLGLSISYTIIKEHKGSLEFESTPGKGTVVTIKLPAVINPMEGCI